MVACVGLTDEADSNIIERKFLQIWKAHFNPNRSCFLVRTAAQCSLKMFSFLLVPGTFDLGVPVDALFFIGSQLVATSHTGKIGVWNSMTQHWQVWKVIRSASHCTLYVSGISAKH